MNSTRPNNLSNPVQSRVLVCSPHQEDVTLSVQVLGTAGFAPVFCADMAAVCQSLGKDVGALLLGLEMLTPPRLVELVRALEQYPLETKPTLLILAESQASDHIQSISSTLRSISQVIVITRPISAITLTSVTNAALALQTCQHQNRQLSAQLEKSVQQRDEFLAMLGHELRNPLAAISNAVALLKQVESDYPPLTTTQQILGRQTEHLTTLLNQLLDVSRITRGFVNLSKTPVDLTELINEVLAGMSDLMAKREPQLVIALPSEPLWVNADPIRLKQVLTNLLQNSVQYSVPVGQIVLEAKQVGEQIEINVRDDGMGMTPEMLNEVFNSFAQAKRSLDRSLGGLGLGLTVAKSLVELHGGEITASSPGLDQGSEFVVRLPAGAGPCEGVTQIEPEPEPATDSTKESKSLELLVVDDNRDAARSLGLLLESLGHQVHLAYDGQSALNMAQNHHPQAVLLDIGLPKLDGYKVAQRLREDSRFAKSMLIAITGYGGKENQRLAKAAGFNHHLTKPLQLEALQSILVGLSA